MEVARKPEAVVALFESLAQAEAALNALQEAGVPYPDIRMGTHDDTDRALILENAKQAGVSAPDHFWSLVVLLDPKWADKAPDVLRQHQPFAIGRMPLGDNRWNDTERGAIAWRHYVFETSAAGDWAGESAGTTGFTGVTSSGVFADGALAEGNPPTKTTPAADERRPNADGEPTSDTMEPQVSKDRSRPETELK
jgi:hypothetical protein